MKNEPSVFLCPTAVLIRSCYCTTRRAFGVVALRKRTSLEVAITPSRLGEKRKETGLLGPVQVQKLYEIMAGSSEVKLPTLVERCRSVKRASRDSRERGRESQKKEHSSAQIRNTVFFQGRKAGSPKRRVNLGQNVHHAVVRERSGSQIVKSWHAQETFRQSVNQLVSQSVAQIVNQLLS